VNNFIDEIHFPTNNEIPEIKRKFAEIAGLPQSIVGCIDGSPINIIAPTAAEEQFVDRHGNHSINLSAICGPDGLFYWLSCSMPGSVHDARVFKESQLFQELLNQRVFPPNSVLLGDSAYPLLVCNLRSPSIHHKFD
jgi:hypothetical protein